MRQHLWGLLAVLAAAASASATTANDLCSPAADPCIVLQGTNVVVSDGSVIDLGNRALVLASGSGTRLDAGVGSMTILARSVTLNPGSALLASSGSISVITTQNISVLRAGTSRARIDVADFLTPGTISLDAGGTIEVQGIVTAQGSGADGGNGSIGMMADGNVIVSGEVNASGGGAAFGGDVFVESTGGDFVMSGFIDVTAGSGAGTIDISVFGGVNTVLAGPARLDAKADGPEGDGGSVDIVALNGDVTLNVPITAQGTTGVDFAGSGGDVTIEAVHGSVMLNAAIDMSGAVPDGDGGDLDVSAGLDIVQTANVTSLGRDQTGVGGSVFYFAEGLVTLGSIDVSGTCLTCSGGDVSAVGWCGVEVPSGAIVKVTGDGGTVLLRSEDITARGRLESGSVNTVVYRLAANPPDLVGAVITPSPILTLDPGVVPCGGPVAPQCGNGVIDPGETCDDGNTQACDGCSPTCVMERCGDGKVGCNEAHQVEVCDDGNTTACDGCNATCTRHDKVCGDGITECGEQCDTGSAIDCDAGACSAICQVEVCGNGRTECNEQCDEGGATETCSGACELLTPPSCGDGVHDPGEGCDDGDLDDCDGCSHLCQVEGCGNGLTECGETCDDFNTESCDGCSATCQEEVCGNEIVDCGEECDLGDQNGQPGADCLECRFAPVCSAGGPDACIPCGGVLDCDPLGRCAGTNCMEGVCAPDPLDCTSDDPCEIGTCVAETGCRFDPVLGFDSVRCRLDDLEGVLGSEGVSDKARTKLGKLVGAAQAKVDAAETALGAGKTKPVGKALGKARGKMIKFGKKVVKLQPKQITDPDTGAALSERSGDAVGRIETLRGDVVP